MFEHISIKKYQLALTQGRTSCAETVRHYLSQIEKRKPLNAFVHVFADEAIQKATALDKKRQAGNSIGKLHGVVIAIKDVICYKDHPLSAASGILNNFTSIYSATAVEKLLQEEAIIIGVCNCDEFAMGSTNENSVYGNVLNAIDETRVPGGSSGGSAVAVQAGLCMVSLGSDTGGSVRQPADFCGIVGLKPTYGRISRYGLIAYASSFDQIGIFANNIEDASIVLEIMAGADEYDSTVSQKPVEKYSEALKEKNKKFRFAYFKETFEHPSLDIEITDGINKLIDQLKNDGHEVTALSFEYLDYIVPAYYILTTAEASSNLSRYDGVRYGYRSSNPSTNLTEFYKHNRSEGFGKEVKRRIMLGTFVLSTGYYDAYFAKAQKVRRKLVEKTELVFSEFDFILMPTSPSVAFKIGEKTGDPVAMYLADIYTVFANLTGIPGISLPLFNHSNGMPFGVQLMAKQFNELSLLQASQQLMSSKNRSISRVLMRYLFTILILIAVDVVTAQQTSDTIVDLSRSRNFKPVDSTIAPVAIASDPKIGFKDLYVGKPEEEGLSEVQMNPRAISFVEGYMAKNRKSLEKLKGWGRPYFDMIDAVLNYHGLPRELKYLAVIESYLRTYAVSWAGAVGPWQFMPATGRRFGLKVNEYVDERTDYYKSTHAAAKYLSELYNIYNDWLLVIAAYNGGPGNVDAAIRKSKSRNFWELQHYLPAESRDHVKKFIATHYVMEGDGGVTTLTKDETEILKQASNINPATKNLSPVELTNSKVQAISGRYNSLVITKHITFSISEFNRYNPDFDKLITHNGKYELRLPSDKMDLFMAKRYDILNESLQIMLDSFKQSLSAPAKTQPEKKSFK